MYTEGFEDLEETEKEPRRTYVSGVSQQDVDKLSRENEKLKKSLEKEKFFNKLLDQELKDAKAEATNKYPGDYNSVNNGPSKGSFYTLLLLTLVMAGFIGYTLYFNKQYNLFGNAAVQAVQEPVSESPQTTASDEPGISNFESGKASANDEAQTKPPAASNVPAKDSVPNIIGNSAASNNIKRAETSKPAEASKKKTADDEYNEAEVEAAIKTPLKKAEPKTEVAKIPEVKTPAVTPPAPVADTRPVIGKYQVTSKANFYNGPDENTLRSAFISAGNKTVNAYEDKNGFIYTVYSEAGLTQRGWLSKKDLTKAD